MRWTTPMMVVLAGGVLLVAAIVHRGPSTEAEAFASIYYTQLLSGRDPEAALRKTHFTAGILMKQFGKSRSEAAADVAKFMIWRGGNLCGGG
jgi:hypothetical protein